MATKKRSRKDLYARLVSYVEDCQKEARIAIDEALKEEYLPVAYKKQYHSQLRRVEQKLSYCTSQIVRWKDAIRNVELEYLIELNLLYNTMKSEFEYFDGHLSIMDELEKEIVRSKSIVKMDQNKNVYEKTMHDYSESISQISYSLFHQRIFRRARARKYSSFDTYAWNAQMRALYDDDKIVSNEVFNSYKLDSLTKKRSFSYIKNIVNYAATYQLGDPLDVGYDLYLMCYTTPVAVVSIKMDLYTLDMYAEIRFYNAAKEEGYEEARIPVTMQTDLYKLYESCNFSQRQRRDASLKYERITQILNKYDEE